MEVLVKDVVIPLGLVEEFGQPPVQVFEKSEDLPHGEGHPLSLQLGLEHAGVDPFVQQEVFGDLDVGFIFFLRCLNIDHVFTVLLSLFTGLPPGLFLELTSLVEEDILELCLQLLKDLGLTSKAVLDVVTDLVGDHVGVNLEEVKVGDCRVSQVAAEGADVDLSGPIQVEET